MKQCITFADVNIIPKFSTLASRADVNLSVNLMGFPYLDLPILSSNMDSISESAMCRAMEMSGGLGVLHRFQSIEDNVKMLLDSKTGGTGSYNLPAVSIGLGIKELERAEALKASGAYTFFIDVNHGANIAVVNQVKEFRKLLGNDFGLVVGNFATKESIYDFLAHLSPGNVDGIKIGIGNGSICLTRVATGVGVPQLSALLDCAPFLKRAGISVISDGGVSSAGDCAKAIAAGADLVMTGSLLAGTEETPGEIMYVNGLGDLIKPEDFLAKKTTLDGTYTYKDEYSESFSKVKKYRGSASRESYEKQGKVAKHRAVEGESFWVPCRGSVANVLQDIEGGLRGSLSMVGAHNMKEFHELSEFIQVSQASIIEAGAHNTGRKV